MKIRRWWTTRVRLGLAVGCALLLGLVGVALVAEGYLLWMPLPRTAQGRAWRTLCLVALSSGVAVGTVGGVVGLLRGYPFVYAGLLGALAGLVGLVLGALTGLVVSLDGYRRERLSV